jgi:hypothetical protein
MAEYYLISQLPSLDGISENTPLPITEERFSELCSRFLSKKAKDSFEKLTLAPSRVSENSGNTLIDAWNESERNLRFALAKIRAEKMNKNSDIENKSFSPALLQAVRTAVDIESPLDAETFLNKYRLDFLETLRPADSFSEEFVFYYGLRLKLLERIRKFDSESGEIAYRNFYDSIINGDRSEVIQ